MKGSFQGVLMFLYIFSLCVFFFIVLLLFHKWFSTMQTKETLFPVVIISRYQGISGNGLSSLAQ